MNSLEERIARLEALFVLTVDQLEYAFPGGDEFKGQRQRTTDFSGENTHGLVEIHDTVSNRSKTTFAGTSEGLDIARARFANLKAVVEELRAEVKP